MTALHRPMLGESGYERAANDGYWTPAWCTEALLAQVKLRDEVWEPACGKLHIVNVLKAKGYAVSATDIIDYGQGVCGDFLKTEEAFGGAIVTNPPYVLAEEFIRHALTRTKEREGMVAMLLRNEYDCASSRVDLFRAANFACKLVLTRRPRWSENDVASPRHNFAWFVWDWQYSRPYAEVLYQPKERP